MRIDWLAPYPIRGSGGHRTIFNHVRFLVEQGHECVLHVQERGYEADSPVHTAEQLKQMIEEYFFPTGARIEASWNNLERCDILLATMWQSAKYVANSKVTSRKGYFVQDFEACFGSLGDGYLQAEQSYQLGLEAITIGRWLTNLVVNKYRGSANYFDFSANEKIYFASGRETREPLSIACIYQPDKPRRCPWLCREALSIVKHHIPNAKIYLFGSDIGCEDGRLAAAELGLISPEECAALYRKVEVGLCISASNPSRIPFEMMACGAAVVDIDRENNHFDYDQRAISLAESTPEGVAGAIIRLLRDREMRSQQIDAGLAMMRQRTDARAFAQFEALIFDLYNKGSVRHNTPPLGMSPLWGTTKLQPNGQGSSLKDEIEVLREELRVANILLQSGSHCMKQSAKVVGSKLFGRLWPW